jgi:hypothetical protein
MGRWNSDREPITMCLVLTAPTWTYSAAGGANPFIVPARGGFIAAAINTESGATIIGLGRRATRFARPLRLEPRGVAIFAQPAPHTLPHHVWAVGYSTTAGVAPRLIGINREGEVLLDVARPELAWREGRSVALTETDHGPVLHVDDRHLVLDARGDVVADVPRPVADSPYAVEGGRLFAHDGAAVVVVDLVTGRSLARIPVDGRPAVLRPDLWNKRLALRLERVLLALDLEDLRDAPRVRALIGGLTAAPSVADGNLRPIAGPPAGLECVDDDGAPRWAVVVGGASAVFATGFFVGGELLLTATFAGGDRVLIAREGAVIFERPRAGAVVTAGALARVGERVAVVVAPGAPPSAPIEFGSAIDVASMRGGGAVAFERPTGSTSQQQRLVAVDAAGARVLEVTEGGAGARWAAVSDGLIAVPRTNAARIDLFDTGAPS